MEGANAPAQAANEQANQPKVDVPELAAGETPAQLLKRMSREAVKELFIDAYNMLTKNPPKDFTTNNKTLASILKRYPGTYNFADGSTYTGEMVNGLPNGKGKRTWADGHTYDGEFFNGREDGMGEHKYPNGEVYNGEFRGGLKHGLFNNVEKNETFSGTFYGSYQHDKKNGPALLTFDDGALTFCIYKDGVYDGLMMSVNADKTFSELKEYADGQIKGETYNFKLEKIEVWADGVLLN